jgi:tryptophan synthase beta subunit
VVFFTNKTDRHDITEILLKVALNTINQAFIHRHSIKSSKLKINNAIGQALLAKRMGKTRIIAETGAGQPRFGNHAPSSGKGVGLRPCQ